MNLEVQNVKHMNEKTSQMAKKGFNLILRQNEAKEIVLATMNEWSYIFPLKTDTVEFQTLFSCILHGNRNVLKKFTYFIWTIWGNTMGNYSFHFKVHHLWHPTKLFFVFLNSKPTWKCGRTKWNIQILRAVFMWLASNPHHLKHCDHQDTPVQNTLYT